MEKLSDLHFTLIFILGAIITYFIRRSGSETAIINESFSTTVGIGGLFGGLSAGATNKYVPLAEKTARFFAGIFFGAIICGFGAFIVNFFIL